MHKELKIALAIEVIGNGTGIGLGMAGIVSPTIGWLIILVSNIVGFYLIGSSRAKPDAITNQLPSGITILAKPKKRLDYRDRTALDSIDRHMRSIHGHSDKDTMESDMLNGVLASDLLKGLCSKCGKQRNVRGDDIYDDGFD